MKKEKADILAATLRGLGQSGSVTPARLVAAAKPPQSPLHALFLWDDRKAGKAYRLEQARGYIRYVDMVVVVEDRPIRIPQWVRDQTKAVDVQGYVSVQQLQDNPAQAQAHMEAEVRALVAQLKRTEAYATVLHMTAEVAAVRHSVTMLSHRLGIAIHP